MCKNCMMLPKNLWIRNPEEFFQVLQILNDDIDDGHLIIISETHSLGKLTAGEIKNPFVAPMTIIVQCPECGTYFTCAYQANKGAGFWNRNGTPF